MCFLVIDEKVDQSIQSRDEFKITPLHYAAQKAFLDMMELLLLGQNCDIDSWSIISGTPLHSACLGGNVKAA